MRQLVGKHGGIFRINSDNNMHLHAMLCANINHIWLKPLLKYGSTFFGVLMNIFGVWTHFLVYGRPLYGVIVHVFHCVDSFQKFDL